MVAVVAVVVVVVAVVVAVVADVVHGGGSDPYWCETSSIAAFD